MLAKRKIRTIVCMGCGKTITKRMPKRQKYCSVECYRSSPHPERRTGKVIKCEWCGKESYHPQRLIEKARHHFCSTSCANKWQGRDRIVFVCKMCGKTFSWSKSRMINNNPTYCSIRCRNADKERLTEIGIHANLIQQRMRGLNKLETVGNEILDEIGVKYVSQVLVANKFLVDVIIPKKQVVIQWDGEYWHGHPSQKPYTKQQRKRMRLDASQDAYLKKIGFRVLRFWSNEVYKQKEDVKARIMSVLG